ncbi:MAG: hypothetical protein CM1200mP24_10000 [Gammaproteobacteria bacterium]|nr:MAG: hypothetical protein CM1200mP24_10000 [Gammaproteobacteria bacterium]
MCLSEIAEQMFGATTKRLGIIIGTVCPRNFLIPPNRLLSTDSSPVLLQRRSGHEIVWGMEPRPPFPLGYAIEASDWSLLEGVKKKGKTYRST